MEGFVLKSVSGVSWLVPETMVRTGLVRAGFTTRLGGVSPAPRDSLDLGLRRGDDITLARENFHGLTAAAEISGELAILSQVHSGRVVSVTAEFPPGGISLSRPVEADGMIADAPGRVLMTHHAGIFAGCAPPRHRPGACGLARLCRRYCRPRGGEDAGGLRLQAGGYAGRRGSLHLSGLLCL